MDSELYTKLNEMANGDFQEIMGNSPLEKYLNINLEKNINEFIKKKDENNYIIKDKDNNEKESYVKYITLVDFLKYLIGKYKNENLEILPGQDLSNNESKYIKYINDTNNYAYVDSFFYYLTSQLLKKHNFIHGIECYDSFICKKNNCKINIADDLEYLCDSNYFNENIDKLFYFEDSVITSIFSNNKKEKLEFDLSENNVIIPGVENIVNESEKNDEDCIIEEVTLDICENNENISLKNISGKSNTSSNTSSHKTNVSNPDSLKNNISNDRSNRNSDSDSDSDDDSDDDSFIVNTSDESENESEDNYNSDDSSSEFDSNNSYNSDDDDESQDDDNIFLFIKKIPTQVLFLEKCDNTFDNLLENDLLTIEELESAIFQIIVILHSYQKIFKFTHNDLHTNNVMYVETNQEFLIYKINGKLYKLPTFGKIYKIIDFGRAIYNYKEKLLCSDSFSSNGTAHTQYNFGPYYNDKKPVLEPNYSFDLCRLACSIFDFVCDDINNIEKYRKATPVYDLIFSWLYDDNGRNMLYKSNGEDKYPGFKLYKMISKIVHNHIPEKQFQHKVMNKFVVDKINKRNKNKLINIDKIIDESKN